ncbi:MAG: SAM-dependent methyltransferase [Rhodospirillaceae bacterium]|nr:SAM-dependent methyltransferase [Rhodospirillaceae bacterium]
MNVARARQLLRNFDVRALFIEELGWDRHNAALEIVVLGSSITLSALAEKRGMVAYHCPAPTGQSLPDYAQRRKIELQVAKATHEHLIVFTDPTNTIQIWQWVKREPGKPAACREHTYRASQPGDALLQKLEAIAFTLDEEETLSLTDVTRRARVGFDVERVTKRFYDRFQKEHAAFLRFIAGISKAADREWYASVMLNRLMFVYFIQRKGFLDGDRDYLRNRLARMRAKHGRDKFYSFYRYFLLRLFHEGLGGRERSHELEALLGRIPYLNGGLFDIHELEQPDRYGTNIEIPDSAFERIFDYFDQYQWHLDERPLKADNEINPDVLGYIFEKYINQKQMGAYYTKEDVTEYIGKNTVLPFLFDAARAKCRIAFENPGGPTVWNLLQNDPDRYVYGAVRHGMGVSLPPDIAAGINPSALHQPVGDGPVENLDLRKRWNRPAEEEAGLPTETWREVIGRRKRYEDLRAKLIAGEVREINDLITFNLDIRQFAQDAIENCEGPELLRAFWHAIERVTILDPTCGSGAFLFAALNILEPLYEACLARMEGFVDDLDRSGEKHRPEKYTDFRQVLANVAAHPNRRYFILKSIILYNLFGVDLMEEAVEICKLRLFLKLAAQVEPDTTARNFGIEPLPDIDFNIRAGNTLVGYSNYEEAERAITSKLDLDNSIEKIAAKAADLQKTFDNFRLRQIEGDGPVSTEGKLELRRRLKALEDELNRHLAIEYGVKAGDKTAYDRWMTSHQPFHWFIEFHGVIKDGGFGIVLGNPPYISSRRVRRTYTTRGYVTEQCPDIYAWIMERSTSLVSLDGRFGMIVPLSLTFSGGFQPLRGLLLDQFDSNWFSSFARIPAALFSAEVRVRNTIHLGCRRGQKRAYTTSTHRWFEEARPHLIESMHYAAFKPTVWDGLVPKLSHEGLLHALESAKREFPSLERYRSARHGSEPLYFRKSAYNWISFSLEPAPCYDANGKRIAGTDSGEVSFSDATTRDQAHTLLNGKIGLLWWAVIGDDFHVTLSNLASIPFPIKRVEAVGDKRGEALRAALEAAMQANLVFKLNAGKRIGNYNLAKCRDTSDRSDAIWRDALGLQDVWDEVDLAYVQLVKTDFGQGESDDRGGG